MAKTKAKAAKAPPSPAPPPVSDPAVEQVEKHVFTITEEPHSDLVVPEEEKKEPYYPLVVETFTGLLPGQEGYDPKKDRMMIGFQMGSKLVPYGFPKEVKIEDVTAYDFLTNPKTGLRAYETKPPWGSAQRDLTDGIPEWAALPPILIWNEGDWLSNLIQDERFEVGELATHMIKKIESLVWPGLDKKKIPKDIYNFWVVSGEGTPNNNLYVLYELPDEVASSTVPKHPLMWKKALRERKVTSHYSTGYSGYDGYSGYGSKPAAPKAPAKPKIPVGVRMRCPGCGHWFKMDDLSGHDQVCGKGMDADWAMMCCAECGCSNLDEASTPKPGFPKKVVKAEENGGEAVSPSSESSPTAISSSS